MLTVLARRLISPLAALTALVRAAAAGLALAPAAHVAGAQNRVRAWAFTPAARSLTGSSGPGSACSHAGSTVSEAALASSFCVATEAAASAGDRAIVVGEDMEGRASPTASRIGADYYKPAEATPEQSMDNRRWIKQPHVRGMPHLRLRRGPGPRELPRLDEPVLRDGVRRDRQARLRHDACEAVVVPIVIQKHDGLYAAEVTPPHGGGGRWSLPCPMPRDELIAALRERGCHPTDIGDALYEVDPGWLAGEQ